MKQSEKIWRQTKERIRGPLASYLRSTEAHMRNSVLVSLTVSLWREIMYVGWSDRGAILDGVPGMIAEELGVLHGGLGELQPQLLAGVQQAPATERQCHEIFHDFHFQQHFVMELLKFDSPLQCRLHRGVLIFILKKRWFCENAQKIILWYLKWDH